MSIKKQFLKSRPECKVTFKLDSAEAIQSAEKVSIVGDFNNWDPNDISMNKLKNGSFTKVCYLEQGKSVQFRYLIDNEIWVTDSEADGYSDTGMGDQQKNAVIDL